MESLQFSVEKMYRLPETTGSLKAFVDVSVNEIIVIRGIRVVEGKKGLFVSMPQEQGKDNKWYDQVSCKSTQVFEALAEKVLEHYRKKER